MNREGIASGKVILFGEHAVVYGIPAIAVGIDRGARAVVRPRDDANGASDSILCVREWEISVSDSAEEPSLARAFRNLLKITRERGAGKARDGVAGPLYVEAVADLPPGGGLGCSAAMGVAVARALDPNASTDEIVERVMAWERVFHGNASGIDASVSAKGGCIFFRRGEPLESVRAKDGLLLCVGNTGVVSGTKAMVDAVADLRARRPEVADKAFEGIRALVGNGRLALEAGDKAAVGKLMDLNQMLLSGLMVSTQEIEEMCGAAREMGALGAKLTGAGGGGSVVALVDDEAIAERVIAAWNARGFTGFTARVRAPGESKSIAMESSP